MATNVRSISIGSVLLQSGDGIPIHVSKRGTFYIDYSTGIAYMNTDDISTWGAFTILTPNQIAAITNASSPSGANPFATVNQLTGGSGTDIYVTGGTLNGQTLTLIRNDNVNIPITGFTTGGTISDTYWSSGSSGNFSLKTLNDSSTDAVGDYSVAIGYEVSVRGIGGVGFGSNNINRSDFGLIGGDGSQVSGYTSFVLSKNSSLIGDGSAIIGGENISVNGNNTLFVPFLSILSASTNNSLSNILVRDNNGTISLRDVSTISGSSGFDVYVTGGTYSNGTAIFTNNTGGTFSVSGFSTGGTSSLSGEYLPLSGGTVSGETRFTSGVSATTISATTYQNLPLDIRVTGGTYSNGTAIFTNNTGGTFNVTGFTTGSSSTDIYVTGGTFANGTTTLRRNDGNNVIITGYSSGNNNVIYGNGIDQSGTTAASNTLIGLVLISGGTYVAGDVIRMEMRGRKNGVTVIPTNRFYFNTSPTLAGATLIGTSTSAANLAATYMQRTLPIKVTNGTGNGTEAVFVAGTYTSDSTPLNNVSSVAINWDNDVYLLIAGQMASSAETQTLSYMTVKRI
jgi:hypothetical protein